MSVEDAAELARRAIYHATFRDGASGGVVSGKFFNPFCIHICAYTYICIYCLSLLFIHECTSLSVYHVGPNGWKKLSGDDVGELHYTYYPVETTPIEQEMAEVSIS